MATKKDRLGDGKINTGVEMIEDQEEKLWEQNPMEALRYEKIETRKTQVEFSGSKNARKHWLCASRPTFQRFV